MITDRFLSTRPKLQLLKSKHLNMCSKLIQVVTSNYERLLANPKFHDVVIKVGEEPNTRAFYVHSPILATQLPYFATAFSNNWVKRDENNIINFNKPNIS